MRDDSRYREPFLLQLMNIFNKMLYKCVIYYQKNNEMKTALSLRHEFHLGEIYD